MHSAAIVIAAHAAGRVPCAGNCAGVIAFLHSAVIVIAAHAAGAALCAAGNCTGVGVIASIYFAAVVNAAHAAGIVPFAGNCTGVIAFLHSAAVRAAHAADIICVACAGNRAVVMAFLQGAAILAADTADRLGCTRHRAGVCAADYLGICFCIGFRSADTANYLIPADCAGVAAIRYCAALVFAANAADLEHCAGNRSVGCAILHGAKDIPAAHTADAVAPLYGAANGAVYYGAAVVAVTAIRAAQQTDVFTSGHIGIRDVDIFYGATSTHAGKQANIAAPITVQPADGVTVTVKGAFVTVVA